MHRSPLPILADFLFLHNLLNEKSLDHSSFEQISAHIQKKFQKSDLISVGNLLTLLIKNNDLPETNNRLVAYYVLYDIFRNDNEFDSHQTRDSPFIFFLHSLIDSKNSNFKMTPVERNFILQLLASGVKDLAKQTCHHIKQTELLKIPFDLSAVRKNCLEQNANLPANIKCNIMNVLPAPTTGEVGDSAIRELMEGLFRRDTPLKSVFGPTFMTIAPPLLPCEDEICWFNLSTIKFKPVNDTEVVSVQNNETEIEKLVQIAFKQALTLHDQKILESELEKDKDLVHHIGLTPAKLSDLVENNPLIAIKILLMLMSSVQITEYLSALVNMEMSLHSVEVVNRLTTVVELPSEFIHLYISNCINTCEGIQDKFLQNRLVRLLCVFLQSLIRKKIINVKELFIEVEAFCVEFSRIREAAELYKLCKSL